MSYTPLIICLMGPTAAGKSDAAIKLTQQLPCEIVSVDSVMVYRGMDIGTAKPSNSERQMVPHHLIDICDPKQVYSAAQFCEDATVVINEIIARQNDKAGEGVHITCLNENGNPFALGNYFLRIKEPLGRFPGWLHKKHFGAKEVLGSEVLGKLDSGGSTHLLWIPPDGRSVGYVGNVPKRPQGATGDVVSSVEVNYRINFDYHGNVIALDDEFNPLTSVSASPNKNTYRPRFVKDLSIVDLKYPPEPGSVVVNIDGKYLTETIIDSPNTDQFFVDHTSSQILLRGRPATAIVEYRPQYVFVNTANPYRIQFYHDQVFGDYTGPLTIGYDALIDLDVHIGFPNTEDFLTKRIALVAQNYLTSRDRHINLLSAEY